jgi:hypothetical protein
MKVFDPAMCCSTGACGPSVDPGLARFAADLHWLAGEGVAVERFNLAQQPDAFIAHAVVTKSLQERGEAALPLILVGERKVSEGAYPSREELAHWVGVGLSAGAQNTQTGDAVDALAGADSCECGEGGCC